MSMLRGRLSTAGVGGRDWKIVWGRVEGWKRDVIGVEVSICMIGKEVADPANWEPLERCTTDVIPRCSPYRRLTKPRQPER